MTAAFRHGPCWPRRGVPCMPPAMLRSVLTVGAWTMVSRILGFVRDIIIAALLGAGPVADAFVIALKLPNLFRRLFGEGAFNAAFVPAFAGTLATEGPDAARRIGEQALAVMAAWLGALTVVGVLAMPAIVTVLAPGFSDDPAQFALTVELTRITFPYLLLICLVALLSGVLQSLDRFAAAAATPILFNFCTILALWLLTPHVATAGHALAWGVVVSGMLQLVLMALACRAAGMSLAMPRPRLTPQVRLLLRRMGPGIIGGGVTQINLAIDTIIASFLPGGSIAFLYFADRVNQLPLGVIGAAVGTALLPLLSRQVRAGEEDASRRTLNRAIEISLVLTLPAALALAVCATPIVAVLFGRGAFGAAEISATAAALAVYAIALPAYVLTKPFAGGFFARGDTVTPVRIGVVAVALNLALNLALMGPFAHVGIAMATAVSAVFNATALGVVLWRRGHLVPDARLLSRGMRMAAAACIMALALWLIEDRVFSVVEGMRGLRWVGLVLLVAGGMAAYFGSGLLIGAFHARELLGLLRRRRATA